MPDTQVATTGISNDAPLSYRVAITDAAVARAKTRLGVDTIDDLCTLLRLSRQTFWRLRRGTYDIRMSEARYIADVLGWPLSRVFRPLDSGQVVDDAA